MPLKGQGVLTIWNGIAEAAEAEFVAWHVREHIPERVGLPGFLRGRRYVAAEGTPKYFNFYETADADVLTSEAYRRRLDNPTPWTRKVVSQFKDTSRTICRVVASRGPGQGGWIETVRVYGSDDFSRFFARATELLDESVRQPGIVAAHLLEGNADASQGGSVEKAMREGADEIVAAVILTEAVDCRSLTTHRDQHLSDDALRAIGVRGSAARGIYAYQFGLDRDEATL